MKDETLEDARSLHAKDETEVGPKEGRPAGLDRFRGGSASPSTGGFLGL